MFTFGRRSAYRIVSRTPLNDTKIYQNIESRFFMENFPKFIRAYHHYGGYVHKPKQNLMTSNKTKASNWLAKNRVTTRITMSEANQRLVISQK